MMENGAVKEDINRILFGPTPDVFSKLEMVLIADGRRLIVPNVVSRQVVRDYAGQYGDEHYVSFQIGLTTYSDYIYPYRDNLKVELTRTMVTTQGADIGGKGKSATIYTAFLLNPLDLGMMKNSRGQADKAAMENSGVYTFDLQLIEPELNVLRMVEVSGIYRNNTVGEVIQTAMSRNPKADLPATTSPQVLRRFKGVNLQPVSNLKRYATIPVKTGTLLKDLPLYLQNTKGVNSTGIGRYYQDGYWHVYPLYDYSRFASTSSRLVIYNVPQDELMSPERSFITVNNELHVITTGDTNVIDETETVAQNEGTGVRVTRASTLVDGMSTTSGNKSTPNTENTNKAFSVQEKPTGLTYARRSARDLTDNTYVDASRLTKAMGFTVVVSWEHAKPGYLYPGMPVKFFYEKDDALQVAYGTLLGTRIDESPSTGLLTDNLYRSTIKLVIHVKKE